MNEEIKEKTLSVNGIDIDLKEFEEQIRKEKDQESEEKIKELEKEIEFQKERNDLLLEDNTERGKLCQDNTVTIFNLNKEINQLKQQLKELKENYQKDLSDAIFKAESFILKDSIPKEKIKKRIEELKSSMKNTLELAGIKEETKSFTMEEEYRIEELQSLIKDSEKEETTGIQVKTGDNDLNIRHERSISSEKSKTK